MHNLQSTWIETDSDGNHRTNIIKVDPGLSGASTPSQCIKPLHRRAALWVPLVERSQPRERKRESAAESRSPSVANPIRRSPLLSSQ